jgi:hypothetical protein
LTEAANIIAQRAGATAQTFRAYNTFTDASNYERAEFRWTANVCDLVTVSNGSGVARALRVGTDGANALILRTDSTDRITISSLGNVTSSASATATGALTYASFTSPANTNQTLSTEIVGVNFNLSATRQWATGAITTQREFLIQAPTYAFVAASTITNAATMAITGAPIVGTNATITNSFALWVQAGQIAAANGSGTTPTYSFTNGTGYGMSFTTNSLFFAANGFSRFSINNNGFVSFAPGSTTSSNFANGWYFFQEPSPTNITASTEQMSHNFALTTVHDWNAGAITTQRFVVFGQPTIQFDGASTVTNAARRRAVADQKTLASHIAATKATLKNVSPSEKRWDL